MLDSFGFLCILIFPFYDTTLYEQRGNFLHTVVKISHIKLDFSNFKLDITQFKVIISQFQIDIVLVQNLIK